MEKIYKNVQLASELKKTNKKLWNMKVTVIPNVIADLGMVTEELGHGQEELEIGGRVETI